MSAPLRGLRGSLAPGPGTLLQQCLFRDPPLDLEAYDFLVRHMAFSPANRCTAKEALKHVFLRLPTQDPEIAAANMEVEGAELSMVAQELAATEGMLDEVCAKARWEEGLLGILTAEVGAVAVGRKERDSAAAAGPRKSSVVPEASRTNPTAPFSLEQPAAKATPPLAAAGGVEPGTRESSSGNYAQTAPSKAMVGFGGADVGSGATGLTAAVGRMNHKSV